MELIRAKMFLEGYKSSGNYSHEAEISFISNYIEERYVNYLDELRYYRNSITYYGKELSIDYAKKIFELTKKLVKIIISKIS